mgnify:CR=1 FL=1
MLRNIWTTLADGQPIQHKEPGQLIYLQETRAECFYYIISGTVKCYISSPEGEERILAIAMLEDLARRVRLLSGHVDGEFLQADKRIARHLLALIPEADGRLRCTHEEIGSSVGVSRVTVSRVLGEFDRRGWVQTGYKLLRLLDRPALERFLRDE